MKYRIVVVLLFGVISAKESIRSCQNAYVQCRARAQACSNRFRPELKKCSTAYRLCRSREKSHCGCRYDWYNSYYFLG